MHKIDKNKIKYQSINKNDFDELVKIYQESFGFKKTGDNWNYETSKAHLKEVCENLNDQYCFVAVYDTEIIGYILGYEVAMEEGRELFLDIIAVKDTAQGMGIGTKLWKMVMENVNRNKLTAVRLIANPKMSSYKWYIGKGMSESGWVEMILRTRRCKKS
jgi:predicted N-acetyltransferase YhbS